MNEPLVIDAHVHIFSPEMIANRDQLLLTDPWFGEAFGHPRASMRTAEELISSMDAASIDVSVVVGWPWQRTSDCADHNNYLADAAARYPERLKWLGIVNPALPDAIPEIDRCVRLGAAGFGEINADAQGFRWSDVASWQPALKRIAASNLLVMIHTSEPVGHLYPGKGAATPTEVLAAIQAMPELNWVLAHWGGGMPFYELMPEVRQACANTTYDSAATSYLYQPDVFRRVVDLVGVEKVMFGSDWPVLSQRKLVARINELALSDQDLAAIMGGNAARIYGVD